MSALAAMTLCPVQQSSPLARLASPPSVVAALVSSSSRTPLRPLQEGFLSRARQGSVTAGLAVVVRARADDDQEKVGGKEARFSFSRLGTQALVCILTLGFLDAGYSGDWSRIGVLSKDVEFALRLSAFVVVPLAVLLVWFISSSKKDEE